MRRFRLDVSVPGRRSDDGATAAYLNISVIAAAAATASHPMPRIGSSSQLNCWHVHNAKCRTESSRAMHKRRIRLLIIIE